MMMLTAVQVEHSVLEKDQVSEFIQQMTKVIHDHPQAAPAIADESSSVVKSEAVDDGNVGVTSGTYNSPSDGSSPSQTQKEEPIPTTVSEVYVFPGILTGFIFLEHVYKIYQISILCFFLIIMCSIYH